MHGLSALDPWLAENIGHVEGASFGKMPASVPSVGRVLHASPAVQDVVLVLPVLALLVLADAAWNPRRRRSPDANFDATALVVVTMIATLT